MIEVRVSRLAMDATANAYVVVLEEAEGERMLPIWIGRAEAEAIARHLEGAPSARPMTHDLARDLVLALGGTLDRVIITHVEDNTFYASLILRSGSSTLEVDARPSDAIALALRCGATILAAEDLLAHFPALRDDQLAAEGREEVSGEALSEADAEGLGAPPSGDDATNDESEGSEGEGDAGGYRSPSANVEQGPSDLQRYLERLRPEDFGKFRL